MTVESTDEIHRRRDDRASADVHLLTPQPAPQDDRSGATPLPREFPSPMR